MSYPFSNRPDTRTLSHYEQVETALFCIDPNLPLEDWQKIGTALKDDGFDFELFDRWSSAGTNYQPKECQAWWKSFKTGKAHIATLFWYAKQAGYRPEKNTFIDKAEQKKRRKAAEKRAIELQAVIKLNQINATEKCVNILATATAAPDDHLYLKNHHVPAIGLKVDKHGNLLIPVLNRDYQIQSLQSISPSGFKKFYEGAAAKGGFFLLGKVLPDSKIRIAEGYAKGCLSYILTGEPVFVAFYKGNLDHVALMVRNQYPSHDIILNADNDHLDKQGNPRPDDKNGGLIAANRAAKLINGFVCVPHCSTGTDFNDVFAELGQAETLRQLSVFSNPNAREPAIAASEFPEDYYSNPLGYLNRHESEKSVISDNEESVINTLSCLVSFFPSIEKSVTAAILENCNTRKHCKNCNSVFIPKLAWHTHCPSCFIAETKQDTIFDTQKHSVKNINTRFMPDDLLRDGVNIIKATYCTGKTYLSANYIKANPQLSVLYVAHLITLCEQAAKRFGIESYNDHKNLSEHDRLSICINSLIKLMRFGEKTPCYDVLILDEIEQLISRLTDTGKEAIQFKPQIFNILKYLIQNAKMLICLDADISKITLDFIESCRPNERFNIVHNGFKHRKIMYLHAFESDIIKRARDAAAAGEPALLMTNSIGKSEEIYKLINCQNKRVINSRTSSLIENRDFLKDVDSNCKDDLLTIISPSVSTGFSIEGGHYQHNLGIFSHLTNTPLDCLQQLERDRVSSEKHVYISNIIKPYKVREVDSAHDFNTMSIFDYEGFVSVDPVYSQLVANVNERNAKLMSYFKEEFIKLAESKGYIVINAFEGLSNEEHKAIKAEQVSIKAERKEEKVDAVCNVAPVDNHAQYEELKKCHRLTPEQKLQIEQYEVKQFYATEIEKSVMAICESDPTRDRATVEQEVFKQVVIADDSGKRREQIRNLKLAVANWQDVKQQQEKSATGRFKEDVDYITVKHLLLSQLFKAIGINQDLTLSKEVYTAADLTEFIEYMDDERELLKALAWEQMPSKEAMLDNPYRYVRTLLDSVGLSQTRAVKFINKKTQCIGYKINPNDLEKLHFFLLIKETPESVISEEAA